MTEENMRKTIAGNIAKYRKQLGMTQIDLSEKINYSDKSISKWERGDGIPDVPTLVQLAEIFGVSLDDLVNYDTTATGLNVPPKGRHAFGLVTVGDKEQIVIPAKARKIFNIQPGDKLIVLGDESQGLALLSERDFWAMVQQMRKD